VEKTLCAHDGASLVVGQWSGCWDATQH